MYACSVQNGQRLYFPLLCMPHPDPLQHSSARNSVQRSSGCCFDFPPVARGSVSAPCRWCCGDMPHMDLSIWALQKLGQSKFGVIGIKYRCGGGWG